MQDDTSSRRRIGQVALIIAGVAMIVGGVLKIYDLRQADRARAEARAAAEAKSQDLRRQADELQHKVDELKREADRRKAADAGEPGR